MERQAAPKARDPWNHPYLENPVFGKVIKYDDDDTSYERSFLEGGLSNPARSVPTSHNLVLLLPQPRFILFHQKHIINM